MSKLNATDIQGFVLRGYNMPFARFLFLHFTDAAGARRLIGQMLPPADGVPDQLPRITTGQLWDNGKPQSTLNIAFTHKGLTALNLPIATLISFPVEFQQGMKARAGILGDTGKNAPEHWDEVWREGHVHAWLAIHALSPAALETRAAEVAAMLAAAGVRMLAAQDAASLTDAEGKPCAKEHFGYTDGFGNPDYLGVCRNTQPGQGKLLPDGKTWAPLATGELLLGYADEAGELPVAPVPHILAANGTFMVYRKLHQNVGTFRNFLNKWAALYGDGSAFAKEKLASKFIGRWRDGTPIESSPDAPNPAIVKDPNKNTDFTYGADASGSRCPVGAHIRRVQPRDAFGFNGRLVNRRRITRRGLPYGPAVPEPADDRALLSDAEAAALDATDRGVAFMVLNACISRQFEFVQQQWISYGNDAHLGNEKDLLIATHGEGERYGIQGDANPSNPPLFCTALPNFVELRGGDYFFLPSITALAMIARELVDPR
jgi:Dyp-type peroxidase family